MSLRPLVLVFRRGPHGSARGRDGLDVAFAALAFDQPLALAFVGEGVLLLAPGQDPEPAGFKHFAPAFRALAHHGLDAVTVDAAALRRYGLAASALLLPACEREPPALAEWLGTFDHGLVV